MRHAASEAERLAHCEAAQRSLDLAEGPLLRAVALQCGERWQLLVVIHHLVVDGVSWRVLVEDLRDAYQQRRQGQQAVLPARTASYQRWSQALRAHAATRDAELPHWQALAQVDASLPCDDPDGPLTIAERDAVTLTLPADLTRALLQRAPAAYRTRVNDLLLTALARALTGWSGRTQVLIDLESHGRVAGVDDTLDLSRTVGWFTTLFPVALDGSGTPDGAIKAVKEQLRAVPGEGIGFGLLRRFGSPAQQAALAGVPKPEVVFNYLGQLDASFAEDAPWRLSSGSAGANQDPATPLSHPLSVSGQVQDGQLRLSVAYARRRYRSAMIEALAAAFRAELKAVVTHCTAGAAGLTPSDFPLAGLSQAGLDALGLAPQKVQDIYPLSPMQAGMLFHSVFGEHGSAYTNQLRVDVDGIEPERFTTAWHAVLARHDSLRSGFLHRADPPLQWVARQAALPVLVEDWRGRGADEIDAFADRQREQGFDLERPPLMRVALLRTGAQRHHLVWTVHHLLLDGWSTAQLLGEVLRHYAGEALPASGGRFADYIGWLQSRDAAAGEAFWKAQLASLDAPTRLLAALPAPEQGQGQGQGEHHHELDAAETTALASFARAQKVTLNTLVQAAWLLLLQRCTGQPCVAFGATVAGRAAAGRSAAPLCRRSAARQRRPLCRLYRLAAVARRRRRRSLLESAAGIARRTDAPAGGAAGAGARPRPRPGRASPRTRRCRNHRAGQLRPRAEGHAEHAGAGRLAVAAAALHRPAVRGVRRHRGRPPGRTAGRAADAGPLHQHAARDCLTASAAISRRLAARGAGAEPGAARTRAHPALRHPALGRPGRSGAVRFDRRVRELPGRCGAASHASRAVVLRRAQPCRDQLSADAAVRAHRHAASDLSLRPRAAGRAARRPAGAKPVCGAAPAGRRRDASAGRHRADGAARRARRTGAGHRSATLSRGPARAPAVRSPRGRAARCDRAVLRRRTPDLCGAKSPRQCARASTDRARGGPGRAGGRAGRAFGRNGRRPARHPQGRRRLRAIRSGLSHRPPGLHDRGQRRGAGAGAAPRRDAGAAPRRCRRRPDRSGALCTGRRAQSDPRAVARAPGLRHLHLRLHRAAQGCRQPARRAA
ncbi:hypothetical protein CBM2585_B100001 [Cupriavidus taiwanensis]|nr:hypothetical protein CBM2585_B100001 [Cupriavidus taiwanensis]